MAGVSNTEVFGLASSIYRSGYPMRSHVPAENEYKGSIDAIEADITRGNFDNPHIKRAIHLANAKGGGHDQFLTGIVVNFDLTLSNKAWVEAERYTFLNFISSMSTMHRISTMPIGDCCNGYTSDAAIGEAECIQAEYNDIDGEKFPTLKRETYLELLYSLPSGFEITAGMTTNYRCLKNIYAQRRHHRLPDWHAVCDWIETLPLAELLGVGSKTEE